MLFILRSEEKKQFLFLFGKFFLQRLSINFDYIVKCYVGVIIYMADTEMCHSYSPSRKDLLSSYKDCVS